MVGDTESLDGWADLSESMLTSSLGTKLCKHNDMKAQWRARRSRQRAMRQREFDGTLAVLKDSWRVRRNEKLQQARQLYLEQCAEFGKYAALS